MAQMVQDNSRYHSNRILPNLPPEYYKSYSLRQPLRTHFRPATCYEFECDEFVYGFVLTMDLSTELGQRQLYYVQHDKSRKCHLQRVDLQIMKAVYGPGNDCFEPKRSQHRVPIGRPPFLLVAEGDWRGNPRGTPVRRHRNVEDWVDDFANHQQALSDAYQKG